MGADRSDEDSRQVGRPRSLDLDQVVSAAIELTDEVGVDGLTMPKLAKRLGVGTMTLYGYVSSKQALLDEMAGRIFDRLSVPDGPDWRTALTMFFGDFRAAAVRHPSLAALLANGRITIPAVFDVLEACFRQMTEAGISIENAVRTFYAALAYTLGFVIWEIPRTHLQTESAYAAQWEGLLAHLVADEYPTVSGPAADMLPSVASERQFQWGLERVLTAESNV